MAYEHITRTEAEDAVALRLHDSSLIRWSRDNITTNLTDALRTWSMLTGMWQEDEIRTVSAGSVLIDIPSLFTTLRSYTVTDQDLVGAIQYHMLETKSVSSWTGTKMFVMADIVEALQRRRDQFLLESRCRMTRHSRVPAAPAVIEPDTKVVTIDPGIMDVRRAIWTDVASGKSTPLWPTSDLSLKAANPLWDLTPGLPRSFSPEERASVTLQIGPPPVGSGYLDLVTIDAGAELDAATGVLLGVPDDMTPAIMWGAMADLLGKDGPARDYARALFCERRYQLLVAAAQAVDVVKEARINGRLAQFTTVAGLDRSRLHWQNKTGSPRVVGLIGPNLLVIEPVPASDVSLQLSLVRNAPIPAAGEYLQIGKEYLDFILGYTAHLCMFKIGGQELASTTQLADAFFQAAVDYNERLAESATFEEARHGRQDDDDEKIQKRGIRRVTGGTV